MTYRVPSHASTGHNVPAETNGHQNATALRLIRTSLMLLLIALPCPALFAQNGGAGGNFPGGILVHPSGFLDQALQTQTVTSTQLRQLKQAAAKLLPEDLNTPSSLRCLSLRQLEQALAAAGTSDHSTLPLELQFPGGLTRIDFVMLTDSGDDLLIAGPAEGFAPLRGGRMVGTNSGRPVLCLQDLLIALQDPDILQRAGCSIDPDPERLATSQAWLAKNASPATLPVATARLEHMIRLLGNWHITTFGVPEDSRMALAMIEADYLMKRIAIGIEPTGVRGMKSSLALAKPGDNMMRRWWFAPNPQCLTHDGQHRIWNFQGPRWILRAQEEILDNSGNLVDSPTAEGSSSEFAQLFNQHMESLAEQFAALADLQNTFDLLMTAAILRDCIARGTLSWTPSLMEDPDTCPTTHYPVPRESPSLLKTKNGRGGLLIGAFTGGVHLPAENLVQHAAVTSMPATARLPQRPSAAPFPDGQWWRDPQRPAKSGP